EAATAPLWSETTGELAGQGADGGGDRHARCDPKPATELLEAKDLPALTARNLLELGIRVDRNRIADRLEHRQIGCGIGVGPRALEVDSLPGRELAKRIRLALAIDEGPGEPSGVPAVHHFRP